MSQPLNLRAVAKRAVRDQIIAASLARFRVAGFSETTVEQIANDVGMSTRTFFRYFRSKDEVPLDATYAFRERFLNGLRSNLPTDDLWDALCIALQSSVSDCHHLDTNHKDREMQALICSTPTLLARQLEFMEKLQREAAELCLESSERWVALGLRTVHAVVGSAFACYRSWELPGDNDAVNYGSASEFRALMKALRPTVLCSQLD